MHDLEMMLYSYIDRFTSVFHFFKRSRVVCNVIFCLRLSHYEIFKRTVVYSQTICTYYQKDVKYLTYFVWILCRKGRFIEENKYDPTNKKIFKFCLFIWFTYKPLFLVSADYEMHVSIVNVSPFSKVGWVTMFFYFSSRISWSRWYF